LLGRLDDPVPEVRREVVLALGRLRDARAVVPLLGKVLDPVPVVRRATASALGALADARAVSALVLVLRDADEAVRVAAVDAVGRLADPSVVSSVIAVLDDTSAAVRAAALGALARLATPEALEALVARLGRDAVELAPVLAAVARAGTRALPALRSCVDTHSALGSADGCARGLGRVGDASDVERVRSALERGTVTAPAALSALGELAVPAALPPVLERLSDPDAAVRAFAATALTRLLDPRVPDGRAVDPLLRAMQARGISVTERARYVRLLGRTGALRAGSPLARVAQESTYAELSAAALEALGELGPAGWDAALLAGLDHESGDVRGAAALGLRRAGSGRSAPLLLARLERAAEQDREALGVALPGVVARSQVVGVLERIAALLGTRRGTERDALIEALAEGGSRAARFLARVATSPDGADRAKLAEALAGQAGLGELAVRLAADRDERVRANAVWSLGTIATPAQRSTLVAALNDREPGVAANAAAALGRVSARLRLPAAAELCGALQRGSAALRANALAALRLTGEGCAEGRIAAVLAADPARSVRAAAARLLAADPSSLARDARRRCAQDDADADVALACAEPPAAVPATSESVLVYVVPTGETAPVPGTPFALELADGCTRFGFADRRGAVHERRAPRGFVSLGLVAAATPSPDPRSRTPQP
jgi:HEAT repeat protein